MKLKRIISLRKATGLNNSGFTLVELMVVVAVIGVLVAIAVPIYTSNTESAKIATDQANLKILNSVTKLYITSNYPASENLFDEDINSEKDLTRMNALIESELITESIQPTREKIKFYWEGKMWSVIGNDLLLNELHAIDENDIIFVQDTGWQRNLISKYIGSEKSIIVPAQVIINGEDEPRDIKRVWFYNLDVNGGSSTFGAFEGKELIEVILSEGLEHIGGRAFKNNNLTSIEIPESINRIDSSAFRDNNITSLSLPDSVRIDYRAFDGNPVSKIKIGNNVEIIENTNPNHGGSTMGLYGYSFVETYVSNNKEAGTYTWDGTEWTKE
jgi:prepilin-type N-terminal cleavage/methylation domain-containing protein